MCQSRINFHINIYMAFLNYALWLHPSRIVLQHDKEKIHPQRMPYRHLRAEIHEIFVSLIEDCR